VDIDNNPLPNHKIILYSSRSSSSVGLSAEPAAVVIPIPPAITGDDLSPSPGKIRPGNTVNNVNKKRSRLNTLGSTASAISSLSRRQRIQQPDNDSSIAVEEQASQAAGKTVVRNLPNKGLSGRSDRDRQALRRRLPRRASINTNTPSNVVSSLAGGPDIITPVISDLTDASGTVTFAVKSTVAIESPGVSFYAYDSTAQRTIVQRVNNVIFTPGPLARYGLTVSSSLVRKGETFSVAVEAQDQYGNFIKTATGTVGLSAAIADTAEAVVLNPSPATVTLSAGVGALSGLVLGSTGNIRMTAFGGRGVLGTTDITVIAEQLPVAPAITDIVEGDRQVSVQWDPVEDASVAGYRVYQSTLQNGQYTQVTQVSKDVTAASVPGLANNNDYWFKVASYNTAGAESFSAARKATPRVSSITGFKVEITNDAGQWVAGGTAVSWKAGKPYSVRISPVDNTGTLMIPSQSLTVNLRAGTTRHMGTMKFSTDGEKFNAAQATIPAGQQFVVVKAMDTQATYEGTIDSSVTVAVEEGQTPFRSGESGAISIYPDDRAKLGFSTAEQSIAIGSVSSIVNIQVQDQYENLVTGINAGGMVSVKGSGSTSLMFSRDGTDPWNGEIDIDIVNGAGSFYFRDTNAGTPSIRVEDNTGSLQQAIQKVKIVSKSIKITSLPYTLFTGEAPPTPVTVEALNEDGTRDISFTDQDITVTAPSSGTVLFCDTADGTYQAHPFTLRMTDGLGQFYFKSTVAGTPSIKVDSGALGYGFDIQQQTINQRVPNSIEISSTKDQMVADGIQTAEIICVVKDSTGNPVSGVRVNFSKEPSEMGGVSPAFGLTDSDGIITAHFTAGTVSGIASIRATVADYSFVNKSTSIELVAGKPAIILLSAPSGTRVQVGGNKLPVKATVYDRFGNLVSDNTEVIFTASDREKATISSPSTTVNGVASTSLQSGDKSGSVDIEASIILPPPDSSTVKSALLHLSVDAGPPSLIYASLEGPNSLSIGAVEGVIPADNVSTLQVKATVKDQFGNPVNDGTRVYFTSELGSMMAGQPTGSSSTTGGVAVSTLTAPDWGTIRTGSVESEKRGVSKITVTAGDVDGVPMAVNDICRVIFTGTPKTFFITMNELGIPATTATIRAGNAMSFYSYAEDEYGHPLAPATRENPSYATVNFLPGGERSSFSPTADTHNPAGIATAKFTASTRTIDSPAAVTARMRCMGYIFYAENTVITTIMPEKLDHFAFEQHGGGAVNGQPTYTTIWAYDQYDNLKTDYVGSTTIRAQGGKGSIGNGATCSFAADDKGRVDHQPVYTTNFLTKDNPTETITMTVADGPAKGTTGSITIYGGSGTVPGTVSVMASSGPYKAGSSDTLITATVYDNLGIPVKGKPISFTIDNNGSVSPSSAVTDESGRATANVTVAKKAGVVHTITAATSGLAAVNTKITVDANEPAGNLSVVPATASAVAGTADECTTTVVDEYGNPVNGTVVNFKATAQDNSVVGMSAAISGTDGKAKSTFQTNDAGTYTIKAWIGDEAAPAAEGTTTVTVKAGTAARIEVASGNSQSGVINSSLAEFKVRIVDANNNPVNGIAVTFAQTKKPTGADDMEIGNPTTVTGTDSVLGDGIASSGRIAVGDYPGTYKMTATSGTLAGSPVTATFEIVSDTPEITKAFVDGAPLADVNKIYLNDATVTLRLEGSGFKEGMRVWLMAGAFNTPKITAGVIDPMQATAVISTADFPPAPTEGWSICAQNTTSSVFDELPDAFNTIYRQPIITGATPGSGEVNSTLTMAVTGEYFRAGAEATLVRGSDTIAADETIVADNVSLECRFTLPAEGGKSWNLVVTNDDGKDYSLANAVMVAWPAPSVTAIAPDTGNTGETAKSITVTGSNFYDNASVRISKNGADLAAIPGTVVAVTGGNTITALFNLSDPYGTGQLPESGVWDLQVRNIGSAWSTVNANDRFTLSHQAPTVVSITPATGERGQSIPVTNLAGSGFIDGAAVKLVRTGSPDINATNVVVESSGKITCTFDIPVGAEKDNWDVVVTNPDAQSGTGAALFKVEDVTPTVASITPDKSDRGQTVTITDLAGTGFQAGATVKLARSGQADIMATDVDVVIPTQITCKLAIPSDALTGPWNVVVTNPGGKAGTGGTGLFNIEYQAPTVTSITPAAGVIGQGISITELAGSGFAPSAQVKLTGGGLAADIAASSVVVDGSGNKITCRFVIPSGTQTGLCDVVVINPGDKSSTGGEDLFTVMSPAAVVNGINPAGAMNTGNADVTISGANFIGGATVKLTRAGQTDINGTVTSLTAGSIGCTFDLNNPYGTGEPAVPGAWNVVVANPHAVGDGVLSSGFTVSNPAPEITSVTPASGDNDQNAVVVTVSGKYFIDDPATTVSLEMGGLPTITGTVSSITPTRIICTFNLSGAAEGKRKLRVVNSDGQANSMIDAFTILKPAPIVTEADPAFMERNETGEVIIRGSHFISGAQVKLSRAGQTAIEAINEIVADENSITCSITIPATAAYGAWDIVVTNPDNRSGNKAGGFSVMPLPPVITSLSPNKAMNNGAVEITIAGSGFNPGSVKLSRADEPDINGQLVSAAPNELKFMFDLNGAAAGQWTLTVTNADGGSATAAFTVLNPAPMLTGITPSNAFNNESAKAVTIQGSGFSGPTVKLKRAGQEILGTNVTVATDSINCTFDLTGAASGAWDVIVANYLSDEATLPAAFHIADPAPVVSSISPSDGEQGKTVSGAVISGQYFQSGAKVWLTKEGQVPIEPIVTGTTAESIECSFNLPSSDSALGLWDLIVTNPDTQSITKIDAFEIRHASPTVTSIDPAVGSNNGSVVIRNLAGTGFRVGAKAQLIRDGATPIEAIDVEVVSSEKITCEFNLHGVDAGFWSVEVINSDGKSGMKRDIFTVNDAGG
jgi:hypothetical protein